MNKLEFLYDLDPAARQKQLDGVKNDLNKEGDLMRKLGFEVNLFDSAPMSSVREPAAPVTAQDSNRNFSGLYF